MIVGRNEKNWNKRRDEFGAISNVCELFDFIERANEYGHDFYYHYTTISNFNSIYKTNQLWFSDLALTNDIIESKTASKALEHPFCLCFSAPIEPEESITMWYLYTRGEGVRIQTDLSSLRVALNNERFHLIDYDRKENIMELQLTDYRIECRDIVYYHSFKGFKNVEIRCQGLVNRRISQQEFKRKYINDYQFFCKDTCWESEYEVRIVIYLSQSLTCGLEKGKRYAIAMDCSDLLNEAGVVCGPESSIESVLKCGIDSNRIIQSSLPNKIRIPFLG